MTLSNPNTNHIKINENKIMQLQLIKVKRDVVNMMNLENFKNKKEV